MNEQLQTLEHAQQTAIDLAIQSGPRLVVVLLLILADSSVQIAIRPWTPVADFHVTPGDITQAVLETFRDRGIRIPLPQREVRLLDPT